MTIHPMIAVRDVPASADFYGRLLGAVSGHGGDEYEQLLVNGRLVLQLHDCRADPHHGPLRDLAVQPGNGLLLWFITDDFEAQLDRAQAMGLQPSRAPAQNPFSGSMEFWCLDPDGYQIVIAGPSTHGKQRPD